MRTNLTRTAVLTVSLLAAGALLATPGTAQASSTPPTPPTVASAEASAGKSGHGLRKFQEHHGLHRTFRSAADLGSEELANARTVIGVGKGAGIPEQGQVIALMTAMQESKFVNYLAPVDHDSLGIFQQRPSMGWGTPEQITDVPTSSKSFYGVAPFGSNPGLIQIDGWETLPPGDVCQAVQLSAYPDRYAQWEQFARALLAQEGPSVPPIP